MTSDQEKALLKIICTVNDLNFKDAIAILYGAILSLNDSCNESVDFKIKTANVAHKGLIEYILRTPTKEDK